MRFIVDGQELTRVGDEKIASFARNTIYAFFAFNDDWENLQKFVLFILPDKTQIVEEIGVEQEAEIIIPFNALTETYIQISVFGKDDDRLLTSTQEKLIIHPSGFTKDLAERVFNKEIFMLENSEKNGELKRLDRDIFWFIPNKKLLHKNEHNYP